MSTYSTSLWKSSLLAALLAVLLFPAQAAAHCDAENGPVAEAAREALTTGDFTAVAIWVGEEQTPELRKKFEESFAVFRLGGEAGELAADYFMETAVRLHREAEGFPYGGLKPPTPLPEDVALAEEALRTGNLQPVTGLLASAMKEELDRLFRKAREARKSRLESLEAGREWADAYVKYVIYVHGLYRTIREGPAHGIGE